MALINSSSFAYDVFLSFKGEDTRHGFTGYLYNALTNKGIHTFFDDEELYTGEEIIPSVLKAIQESRIAIIVLSEKYASSSFCLDELATIIDCQSKGMFVIPVFYEVDPADVRRQRRSYGEALTKHEERFQHNPDKLQKWKMALHQVANLSGYHFKEGVVYEYKIIERIVDRVLVEISHPARLSVPVHLVGLESRKAEIMKLLNVGSDDGIHIVGIHGMGGIGKSTLARVVYNDLLAEKFDGSCYLENVRQESHGYGGLTHLQSILLQEILGDANINVTSVEEGASMIKDRLQEKKVLLVVDDVNNIDQLDAIFGSPNWFGPGSRIIITTRDEQLLKSGNVKRRYEVKKLDEKDALQLLTWKAFKKDKADPLYEEVLNRLLAFASGIPLALKVIGMNLFEGTVEEWESFTKEYESPSRHIQDVLKISFDRLGNKEKRVFLDIACCFNGYELAEVEDILGAHYGHCIKNSIAVLVKKSLVQISDSIKPCYGTVTLHDLIVDMCREIDRQESPHEPNKRRRLWLPQDVVQVLEENSGTSKIEIICLNFPLSDEEKIVQWDGKAFRKMQNLKTLIIRNGNFSNGPEYLPNSLRVLEWWRYPSNCLPSDFHPKELAICKLPCSRISTIELTNLLKNFVNLRVLKFSSAMFNKDTEFGESSI